MKLNLYAIFHLNLAFSSIEEEQRPRVIKDCYWPLLKLVREQQLPLGIEASGYTLETIAELDPAWVAELQELCLNGPAEFIGSGYVQLIGPLVPAEVNQQNQQLGQEVYQRLLGLQPQLVLVSEQAYSVGLIPHYLHAGYRGLIMEWDNPSSGRSDWSPQWRYLPQRVGSERAGQLPLIWNKSLPFQQFQRYGHGELELHEYLDLLAKHCSGEERVFSLYGNDAEIFDFRPGRFATEAVPQQGEWQRLAELFETLRQDPRFTLIAPSRVLDFLDRPAAGQLLKLQTAAQPVPVKKQAKYNITRWAVTGRDDLHCNSSCHRIYAHLKSAAASNQEWRELCYLWSSDFRTHITERRWQGYQRRLQAALDRYQSAPVVAIEPAPFSPSAAFQVEQQGRYLAIATQDQQLRINLRRGLAVDRLALASEPERSLFGTLPHGYFDEIDLGADYYSGHLVTELPGEHKVTDLVPVVPRLQQLGEQLLICGEIDTPLGALEKRLLIPPAGTGFTLQYLFDWTNLPPAAVRLGHITLQPEAFDRKSLFYRCHNGGAEAETFLLNGEAFDHLTPAGSLVTASQGIGLTTGTVELGDAERSLHIAIEPGQSALTGHLQFRPSADRYLFRLIFSARELDDTCCGSRRTSPSLPQLISFRIQVHSSTPHRTV